MTLSGYCDKNETVKHFVIKCLVYYNLKSKGHRVQLEYKTANGCIIDIFDKNTRIAFEVQKNMNKKLLQEKYNTYLKNSEVLDIVPIPTSAFNNWDIRKWVKILDRFVP